MGLHPYVTSETARSRAEQRVLAAIARAWPDQEVRYLFGGFVVLPKGTPVTCASTLTKSAGETRNPPDPEKAPPGPRFPPATPLLPPQDKRRHRHATGREKEHGSGGEVVAEHVGAGVGDHLTDFHRLPAAGVRGPDHLDHRGARGQVER
jgi:hypothetical protein